MTVSKAETKKGVEPGKFDYQLSQQGISDIFKILSSFYNYLMLESIAMVNPVALIRGSGDIHGENRPLHNPMAYIQPSQVRSHRLF